MRFKNPFRARKIVIISRKTITIITIPIFGKIKAETEKHKIKQNRLEFTIMDDAAEFTETEYLTKADYILNSMGRG